MRPASAGVGGMGWGGSRLPKSSVRTLIAADRLSRCAPQHNLICDWLGPAGWLLQTGSPSSSCHQEDNILQTNIPGEAETSRAEVQQGGDQLMFRERDCHEHSLVRQEGWE